MLKNGSIIVLTNEVKSEKLCYPAVYTQQAVGTKCYGVQSRTKRTLFFGGANTVHLTECGIEKVTSSSVCFASYMSQHLAANR